MCKIFKYKMFIKKNTKTLGFSHDKIATMKCTVN